MWQGHGGYEIAFVPALTGLGGWLLDGALGWTPALTIVFAVVGFFGAVANQYYRYTNSMRAHEEQRELARNEAKAQQVTTPFAPVEPVELPSYVLASEVDDVPTSALGEVSQ